jgi:GNAT superfamily N-acetyltransferase
MAAYTLTLTDAPDAAAQATIGDELDRFNEAYTGVKHSTPLAVLIADDTQGVVVGGLLGHTSLDLFFVDLVFLPDHLRSSGLGSKILQQAEAEAIRRGCRQAMLYTIAFQAPGFYRRHGYQTFGVVQSGPPDQARIFMTKQLLGAAP